MKKLFTIFTILTLCTYGAYGQNAPIDFEEDGIGADWEWTVFENDTNPSIEIIDNPDMSGINTSQQVAQFTALESGQPWAGFESSHGSSELGPFVLDESNSTITVMVWKSVISDVGVKLVSETGWAEAEILVSNTVTNEWEELTFDFSGRSNPPAAEGQFDQIVLYGDFDLDGREQDNVVYFDNINFSESTSQEDEPATAAPDPTEDPDNVISLFSEVYDDVDVDTWRTDWSVGQLEDIEIDGNPTKLYTMLDVVGIETTGDNLVDASGMEYFHMDIWTPNMDVVRIKLVDFGPDGEFGGGDDTEHEIVFEGLAKGEWHSLQIPMDDFEGLESAESLAQYILSGTPVGEGTLYVDNVYFSGDGNGDDPEEVNVEIDASSDLVGFANVFETPENGGEFVFGSPWGVEDIKTEVDSAENTVTLFPNFNTYADNPTDSFWVDQETGLGNKVFEGSTFVEDADLAGKIVTFEGEVQSYTLSPDYDAIAFIRVFNADFSVVKEVSEALTEAGHFSINFNDVDSADALVQYGFSVTGLNANPEDEEALGNVVIGGEEMEDPEEVIVEVDATADFVGFANVFETPENGGEFVFGAPWGIEDIKTEIDPASNTVTLFPNFNTYADNPTDSFWVDQETGLGNKVFEGNTFVEDADLVGKIVTFEGEVLDYSLSPDYEARVFIRVFNADFSVLKEVSEELTGDGQFSITFDDPDADDALLQYGFSITGLNANPEDEEALGNVVISGEPVVGPQEVIVEVDASADFVGFANVFETPENGGDFVFGEPWSVEDIKTEVDPDANTVTLFPNFNTYAENPTDSFWVDQETGMGNKIFEGNTFVEDADLVGKIVTFEGEVQSYTLSPDYEARVFIRVFNADFSVLKEVSQELTEEGHFSITFDNPEADDALVQYGFSVTGLNANPEDEEALGNVVISGEPVVGPEEVIVEVDASSNFIGFANVFETPENGGDFVFGAPWGVEDIKTVIDSASNTVTLFPNFNTYADNLTDSFWVDQETGLGNKVFEGNTFVEDASLVGKIVTFEGEVQSYTLSPDYEARVFIRVFNADFSVLKEVSEELTEEGHFSITFDDPEADDALVQYGFSVTGLNANPEDEEALGNVVIGDEVDPDLDEPMNPAPLPTEDPENVISLFSEAFEDVEVDTWRTEWSMAEFEDIEIQGNPTKLYTMLDFAGIETTGDNLVDATEMEFFHMDIWTPNMDVVRIKLVDFGPDGEFGGDDDTEHEIVFEGLAKGEWHSLQIPLEDFEGLESTANLAQYILSGTPVGEGVLYVDNVYFSKTPVSVSEIEDYQIRLFPNPASDMIHIDSEKTITGITVFDYSGKTVLQVENPSNQIDISALPGGMYVVLIEGKDLFTTKRIVIK